MPVGPRRVWRGEGRGGIMGPSPRTRRPPTKMGEHAGMGCRPRGVARPGPPSVGPKTGGRSTRGSGRRPPRVRPRTDRRHRLQARPRRDGIMVRATRPRSQTTPTPARRAVMVPTAKNGSHDRPSTPTTPGMFTGVDPRQDLRTSRRGRLGRTGDRGRGRDASLEIARRTAPAQRILDAILDSLFRWTRKVVYRGQASLIAVDPGRRRRMPGSGACRPGHKSAYSLNLDLMRCHNLNNIKGLRRMMRREKRRGLLQRTVAIL